MPASSNTAGQPRDRRRRSGHARSERRSASHSEHQMQFTARSERGMVVSPHHLASQAGLDILKDGGDAVEAAVAVAACLAVVYPHMTGIGGDGFWLIAESDGSTQAIDACGRSAMRAQLPLYAGLTAIPWRGPLAANTVAGTIPGWAAALENGQRPPAPGAAAARRDPLCRCGHLCHQQLGGRRCDSGSARPARRVCRYM